MKLVHPNIVQIRAFEENDGNPFLVMDYIDGETLDDWLGERGIGNGEGDIIRILKPIAEALDYAHAEGVVHRDIKPANVMIRKDGRPFIMDFGIAREIQETMTRVTGKMSSGTLMYMSPEQLNGDVPKPAQDVYSFAAMVYECLKGEPPFCRGNIEFQIMNKEPEPLTGGRYGPDEVRFAEQSRKRPASVPAHGRYGPDEVRFAEQSRKRPASVLASRVQESGSIASSVMAGLAKKPEERPKSCIAVLEGAYGNREKELVSGVSSQESGDREVWPGRSPLREAKSLEACERPREPRGGLFGNIAAIILLVFGLVGGIWYWQGTHENEVVSDSLIPAKPSAKPNPPPPPPPSPPLSGPTELDVMEIKVESSAQKGRIERIDDADGFKIKKDGLSDLYLKAVAYENAKSWSSAAVHYTNYLEGCNKLITLDDERKIAKEKYSMAFASQRLAANAESSKYASVRWSAASDFMKKANEHFSQMEFSEAEGFYESAANQFKLCIHEAENERERQVLEALATNPGKVLKKDFFTPKLKEYEWICAEISRVQGELSSLLTSYTEKHPLVREKRMVLNELFEQFVTLMEKEGLGDKARKALNGKSWTDAKDIIEKPSSDESLYFIYEVKSGDSLARIAQKYQITVTEIIKVNKIRPNKLWVGQKLKIPINKSVSNKSVSKVQLWEGGPYWATKNIGAEKPEDPGYYFCWGDTIGYKQKGDKWVASDGSDSNFSFSGDNPPTDLKSISALESGGWIEKKDGTDVLTSNHDAARAHWKGAWRMPTKDEFDDLVSKCEWTWTTRNGKNGYVVRGRGNYASKSIFLPASGLGDGVSLCNSGSNGTYWSSVPNSDIYSAYVLDFGSSDRYTRSYLRCYWYPVRPVQGFTK